MSASQASELAIHGGKPVIDWEFAPRVTMGEEEAEAAARVVRSGVLSGFQGSVGPDFLGGPEVRRFEEEWASYFGVQHAITVNSWTSGLIAMIGAIQIEPGDEVIVTPWSMCASATCVLHWGAIPVFADIDPITFCLDPEAVEKAITPRTRAILAVDIFGQSADISALRALADRYGLWLLSDSAQAPGARVGARFAGTLADVGGFSLNRHKHIQTGEGGVLVTDHPEVAQRVRMIRNHAEAVVAPMGISDIRNMVGFNFRLGEIEAAIGSCQLRRLHEAVQRRREIAALFDNGLSGLAGLTLPAVALGNTHVYYIYAMRVDPAVLGVSRDWVADALRAEGVQCVASSYANLHRLPMFERKIAFGSGGAPWNTGTRSVDPEYGLGLCPVAEDLEENLYLGLEICDFELPDNEVRGILTAFDKVWAYVDGR